MLLIYDVVCQYFIHFHDHIGPEIPFGLQVEAAIGLFHVHAHKDECFFQYATSFIPGAGVVAGEILESLWSSLNSISPMARTATLAHQAEMLDDHASDSNHKKLLGIISNLCKCHRTAINMVESAQLYYENLTSQSGPMAIAKWTSNIEEAEASRSYNIEAMDIYAAKLDNHELVAQVPAVSTSGPALDRWMALALCVEDKHIFSRLKVLMLRLQTIKVIIDSCSFKSPKSDEPRRVQVLDLYCLTRLESESSRREDVY